MNANHRDPVMTSHRPGSQSGCVAGGREIRHPDQMALGRCGYSGNEPFCDGTQLTAGFGGTLAS